MLAETLSALAGAGGTALVGAVATDSWQLAKHGFAQLFGRGDQTRAAAVEGRLERTRSVVEAVPQDERVRLEQQAAWTARLEDLLSDHPEVAKELQALVEQVTQAAGTRSAGHVIQHGVAYGQAQQVVQGHGQQTNVFGSRGGQA
ncbi:hypothetical protein [Micromonospora orduensis]|uniref:hypothetical protein n=1 Tax=Micromonospora orduensis TaxID=1420891 RepID=UPI00142EB642|nr:hypothetical protein [Micromonospora orduensis]